MWGPHYMGQVDMTGFQFTTNKPKKKEILTNDPNL